MERRGPSQEADVIPGGQVVGWWVASVLTVAACAVIALLWVHSGGAEPEPLTTGVGETEQPPRLRPLYTTGAHATAPDSAARSRLEGYRWIDRDHGIVAVPIEDAMRLLAGVADSLPEGAP